MGNTGIIFPHQLFEKSCLINTCKILFLVEEELFFNQYLFHKRKIAFHRAGMKFYEEYLQEKNIEVVYIEATHELADIRKLIHYIKTLGAENFEYIDTTDNWLEKRIENTCAKNSIAGIKKPSPLFINTPNNLTEYFKDKKRMFQTDFYKNQRVTRNILIEKNNAPIGGKWTFDDENRLKYPKGKIPPITLFSKTTQYYNEAVIYTQKYFSKNYGELDNSYIYPHTFEDSKTWLQIFLAERFNEFGTYEDAIVANEHILHHSVLTPMLNVGLLTPEYIITETLQYASENQLPINSLEGFVRQIIGWREFIRAVYELKGSTERTKNYWGFTRKIPKSFWEGTTGIEPIDNTIKKILKTGYCHHIERLMVLGNFMLLCEFDPDEVYLWFTEMFIDAYDWVMVPNVYGMSQFADGGLMATKPYISGSNYIMKMSNYTKGSWQNIWDGLFWRFMDKHRGFFLQNPRLGMLVNSFDKMDQAKKMKHINNAENYLKSLQ